LKGHNSETVCPFELKFRWSAPIGVWAVWQEVSISFTRPNPSTPYGRATPYDRWPAAVFYPFAHPTPYAYVCPPHRPHTLGRDSRDEHPQAVEQAQVRVVAELPVVAHAVAPRGGPGRGATHAVVMGRFVVVSGETEGAEALREERRIRVRKRQVPRSGRPC
jgi:hypothetical protein